MGLLKLDRQLVHNGGKTPAADASSDFRTIFISQGSPIHGQIMKAGEFLVDGLPELIEDLELLVCG